MNGVLSRPTLVLNRQWQPVGVVPVSRALVMLWSESAHVIDPESYQLFGWEDWSKLAPLEGEPLLRSAKLAFRVPEVVTLKKYDRVPSVAVAFSRRNVIKRDHSTCQYCGDQPGFEALTIDHVQPKSRGGATSWDNCVAACTPCNARKADRTPEQAGMTLKRRPTRPVWRPHFAANDRRVPSWGRFLATA